MNWTKTKPTQEGWYWTKASNGKKEICKVKMEHDYDTEPILMVWYNGWEIPDRLEYVEYEWSPEPLVIPE